MRILNTRMKHVYTLYSKENSKISLKAETQLDNLEVVLPKYLFKNDFHLIEDYDKVFFYFRIFQDDVYTKKLFLLNFNTISK